MREFRCISIQQLPHGYARAESKPCSALVITAEWGDCILREDGGVNPPLKEENFCDGFGGRYGRFFRRKLRGRNGFLALAIPACRPAILTNELH